MSLLAIADVVNHMGKLSYKILRTIEVASNRFEYVPLQYISKKLMIKPKVIESRASWLADHKLVKKKEHDYKGYAITYAGLDALALKDLSSFGVINQVGPKIGMGKDGDIWIAYLNNKPRIIKLYRISPKRFRHIRLNRYYMLPNKRKLNWLSLSKIMAKNEFRALTMLYEQGVSVPRPIARNRHVILMDYVDGRELIKVRLNFPKKVFRSIVKEFLKALSVGIVHADLSEFNILVTEDEEIYIIDWPQFIPISREESTKYLERDLQQIMRYFGRKYDLQYDEMVNIIKEEAKKVGIDI